MEPQKPFACTIPECGMSFTNEDHLHVHTKKHDMVLQLGMEQKAAFAADQTPTPTRFIRNCEEVGLFQDLQNVNPFDEGFKRAMDAKHNVLSLDTSSEDVLHTPHLTFPLDADCTLYTANNQRNITISRSSSDESGAVKEYETTTISKLTNEVTTISRLVKPDSDEAKNDKKDVENVSYTNNVIKIHEIRKDGKVNMEINEAGKKDIPPMMSQKSLDYVVDSLTSDVTDNGRIKQEVNDKDDIEVTIKLPSGKRFKMQVVDEAAENDTKEILRNLLSNKKKAASSAKPRGKARGATGPAIPKDQDPLRCEKLNPPVATPVAMGTLIPVKLINALPMAHKIPIIAMQRAPVPGTKVPKPVHKVPSQPKVNGKVGDKSEGDKSECRTDDVSDGLAAKRSYSSASSKRYREKWRQAKWIQQEEIMRLKDANMTLSSENKVLRMVLAKHLNTCPAGDDLRDIQKRLMNFDKVVVVPKV